MIEQILLFIIIMACYLIIIAIMLYALCPKLLKKILKRIMKWGSELNE